jgi:hypothetical protein
MNGKRVHVSNVRLLDNLKDEDSNEVENENDDLDNPPHGVVPSSASCLGKTVNIVGGSLVGISGVVIQTGNGGYLTLDNPAMNGKRVHVSNVRLFDDRQDDNNAMSGGVDNKSNDSEDDISREAENDGFADLNNLPTLARTTHSLIGKLVCIKGGCGTGLVGKVVEAGKAGYLVIDHPSASKQVHVRNVQVLDDLQDAKDDTKTLNLILPSPPPPPRPMISNSEPVTAGSIAHLVLLKLGRKPKLLKDPSREKVFHAVKCTGPDNRATELGENDSTYASVSIGYDNVAEIDLKLGEGQDTSTFVRKTERAKKSIVDTGRPEADLTLTKFDKETDGIDDSITVLTHTTIEGKISLERSHVQPIYSVRRILPPIVMEGEGSALPGPLSHLPPDLKVDVFNLRTGKVMSGNEAVALRDLPELLQFAEYEPIIPPPPSESHEHDPHQR